MNGVNFMSLNKNDKEARDINLEHAKWLDNSSNQIQEVEMQDGSKEENNSKKPKLSIHSKALKIIAGGVILVVGIGIGSMVKRGSENVPVDSAPSISNSMPSEDEIATSMSGAEDEDTMNVHYFPDTLNRAIKQIDFSTFSEFDQVILPDYDYSNMDDICDYIYIDFNFANLVYRSEDAGINGAFLLREIDPAQKLYTISYINMQAYLDNPSSVDNLLDTSITSVYDENGQLNTTPIDLSHVDDENTILIPFVSTLGNLDVTSIKENKMVGSTALWYDFSLENVNNTIQNVLSLNGLDINFVPLQYDTDKTLVK